MDIQEVYKIVDELNGLIVDQTEEGSSFLMGSMFTLITNGDVIGVNFLDNQIWNSDDDEREFFENQNDWEPLKPFLIQEANQIINLIKKIEL